MTARWIVADSSEDTVRHGQGDSSLNSLALSFLELIFESTGGCDHPPSFESTGVCVGGQSKGSDVIETRVENVKDEARERRTMKVGGASRACATTVARVTGIVTRIPSDLRRQSIGS